ncbi:MAG TPA: hypothetical protein VJB87_01740 [Candidatus Nanoarchaeia archaeon]|nr:hypothetical protein [Candidatus Nanoarchaeia archaeon]
MAINEIINPLVRAASLSDEERRLAALATSKGLNSGGKEIDKAREKENAQPLYQDQVVHNFDDGQLVVRTFNRYGHQVDARGVYLLKDITGNVMHRLGSKDVPNRRKGRRGVDCIRLEDLARRLNITPISEDQAIVDAGNYFSQRTY